MYLYHFTTIPHFIDIVVSGEISTTNSDVIRPVAPHFNEDGTKFVDEATDWYHPCVWLTSNPNATIESLSLQANRSRYQEKTDVRITIEKKQGMYLWEPWAKRFAKTPTDKDWFEIMKQGMPDYKTVYVCEKPIPISDFIDVRISIEAIERSEPNYQEGLKLLAGDAIEKSKDGYIHIRIGE